VISWRARRDLDKNSFESNPYYRIINDKLTTYLNT
jgi:hypothetical protein